MSKKSNPTVIGAFVVGAIVLLAVGVILFGGAEMFAKRDIYVAYFTQNTQGLRKGSNVMMNGVHVGFVSEMALLLDRDNFTSKTEVIIEILPDSYILTSDGIPVDQGTITPEAHDQLINVGGLRAVLHAESLVTGQLLIELNFRPDIEPVFRGGDNAPYFEIPTIPSTIQEMLAKIRTFINDLGEGLDPKEIGPRVQNILRGVDELVNSEDLRASLAGVNSMINTKETQELTATLQTTLKEIGSASSDASTLLKNADSKLADLDTDLKPVMDKLADVLDEARATLAAARVQLEGESVQVYQLGMMLKEVEGAARALREFLDYLEQHPEALIKGKQQ
ncbi:MAG: MlaD family protein [Gammaproteobacteria bacterium]|nr:MlaD family protein [Gammaproteobacteria bacterium]